MCSHTELMNEMGVFNVYSILYRFQHENYFDTTKIWHNLCCIGALISKTKTERIHRDGVHFLHEKSDAHNTLGRCCIRYKELSRHLDARRWYSKLIY